MLHSNESQLPLLSHKNSTNHSGYALIYIWKSNLLIQYHAKRKVGHIAVQLYDANNDPVVDGHISAWPAQAPGKKIKFLSNLAETIRYEGDEYPDETFKIDQLNINEIRKDFHRKRTQVKWALYGSGFCRDTNKTINCVSITLELFKKEFYENKKLIWTTRSNRRKISDTLTTIEAGYNNINGLINLLGCICITIIAIPSCIFLFYGLLLSILGLIEFKKTSNIWTFLGTTVLIILTMLIICNQSMKIFSLCCYNINHFIGISPNEVSLLLHNFITNGVKNVSKIEEDGNDLTYSVEDNFDDDHTMLEDLLTEKKISP